MFGTDYETLSAAVDIVISRARRCPSCKSIPHVDIDSLPYCYVYCSNCYDGAPDSVRSLMVSSCRGVSVAIEEWNDAVEAEMESRGEDLI